MATTILAVVFASWGFLMFAEGWGNYSYISIAGVILDVVHSVIFIGSAILLIIYQLKRNKGEETGQFYEYILYAGVIFMAVSVVSCLYVFIINIYHAIDYSYLSFGFLLKVLFICIILQIPRWFLVLAVWLAVDLVHEQEREFHRP